MNSSMKKYELFLEFKVAKKNHFNKYVVLVSYYIYLQYWKNLSRFSRENRLGKAKLNKILFLF